MLPSSEWLPHAQRLSVGMRVRMRHRNESRANMVVANNVGKWWAYCQACKEGAVVNKDHVLLTQEVFEPASAVMPVDVRPVMGSEYEETVGRFLIGKGMMFPYLPSLHYSTSAKRLMIQDEAGCWHGRDMTGRSNRKWMNYNGARFVGSPAKFTVLTEDLFSMWKLRYATRGIKDLSVCCTLGAGVHDTAVLALRNCTRLVWAYDGDEAGDAGYTQAMRSLGIWGQQHRRLRPPQDKDPKDMTIHWLRNAVERTLEL